MLWIQQEAKARASLIKPEHNPDVGIFFTRLLIYKYEDLPFVKVNGMK